MSITLSNVSVVLQGANRGDLCPGLGFVVGVEGLLNCGVGEIRKPAGLLPRVHSWLRGWAARAVCPDVRAGWPVCRRGAFEDDPAILRNWILLTVPTI